MKTWFITGGTPGGFGRAYADAALEQGDNVVLTARRPHLLHDWAAEHPGRVLVLPLDVTDGRQVRDAVKAAEQHFGGIDVLVNNAGRGWYGSVEGTSDADARRSLELNFFAVVDVLRAVLPGMRARRGGWIINMSSVAGLRSVTGFGFYSAAKFAVEGITGALREEVAPFGINVLAVEPGAFRTHAYAGFGDEPVEETVGAYRPAIEALRKTMIEQSGRQPGDPHRAVRAVIHAMRQDDPPHRLVLGSAGYDTVHTALHDMLAELHAQEPASRNADHPPAPCPGPASRRCPRPRTERRAGTCKGLRRSR
ncbi:SDR family NAD(P)-dependent oxidoreductase [Streptomyces zingiberis]|uniref:SDR family NAD(P)-dependent oxidoreductase n=1 Tax=Streptomyces zingiberis TaxID=2053010 RepID=A0ABX1BW14_9ACTN|nr:SDR family NAD(P)-dependent oxidoreductase [Streptomyces zingiberis]NJQ01851.1 SDR family NAD(P)-dependent oxidoreductase [Streptomyces zingiberis]